MNQNGISGNTIHNKVSIHRLLHYPITEEIITSFDLSNKDAFTAIYNKLYPYAFFFAKKVVVTEDAADIVASVFSKLWSNKNTFENLHHIKAYIRTSVRNACISYLRNESSRLRKEERGYEELYGEKTDNSFLKEEIGAEKLQLIYTEIERLPPRSKEIFKLAYLDNLQNSEIAQKLGITTRTVQNQKSTALKMLRMTILTISFLFLHTGLYLYQLGSVNISQVVQIHSGL
jgi:RNA polymerase sigma-70 factor (family 1)